MHLQLFIVLLIGVCFQVEAATVRNSTSVSRHRALHQNQWFGPEYRPKWYNPETVKTRSGDTHFGYEPPHGSETWPDSFPECGSNRQSPINLQSRELSNKLARTSLRFHNYDRIPDKMEFENSGHSMHLSGDWSNENRMPYISGGPLVDGDYRLSQIHWHWGETNSKGSEHTINNKRFPLEMHCVHALYEESENQQFEEVPDNIAVVGYMFEIQERDNPDFNPILEACRRIRSPGAKTQLRPFPFSRIVRTFDSDYVTYEGSLTTPPCSETVLWIVYSKPIYVSSRQLSDFRTCIRDDEGETLKFNYRAIQPINGRTVYYLTN